jgi:hypothetical protein
MGIKRDGRSNEGNLMPPRLSRVGGRQRMHFCLPLRSESDSCTLPSSHGMRRLCRRTDGAAVATPCRRSWTAARSSDSRSLDGDRPVHTAIGYVYFAGATLPDNSQISLEASGEPLGEFENIVGLPISEANSTRKAIVGIVENDSGTSVDGPIGIEAVCFSADGQLTDEYSAFATKDALAPGETSSFQLDLYRGTCDRFLLGAGGFVPF